MDVAVPRRPEAAPETAAAEPESKGRRRFKRWFLMTDTQGDFEHGAAAAVELLTAAGFRANGSSRSFRRFVRALTGF